MRRSYASLVMKTITTTGLGDLLEALSRRGFTLVGPTVRDQTIIHDEITSPAHIRHFDFRAKRLRETADWLPAKRPVDVLLTAGASCPDALLDDVLRKVLGYFPEARPVESVLARFTNEALKVEG